MDIKGKHIVVVGATGGIGNAASQKLAQERASLVLVARNEEKLKELAKSLGGNHSYFAADLADTNQITQLADKLKGRYESIDVLINAAGIGVYKPAEEVSVSDWQNSFALNVAAPFFTTQNLLPLLNKSDQAVVVNMGSGMGVIPTAGRSTYCATKFALRGLTLSLAEEFSRTQVRFVLITLGSTLTEFGPLTLEEKTQESLQGKAYFTPEWVADKLVEVIKADNREIEYTLYPTDYGFGAWKKP